MPIAIRSSLRRAAWLIVALVVAWLLAGCVDKHRDDNPYITPFGYADSQPFG